jgi:hypothetical protein
MKSAEAFTKAIKQGRSPSAALSSLPPCQLEYCARVPINIYRASQELGARFFPIPRFGRYASTSLLIHRATSDLEQLKLWARRRPNFALATGSVSGIFALMADGEVGQGSLLSLCGDDWSWLDTLRTAASQIRFNFFTWPRGRQQREGSLWIGEGLRIFGEGDWLLMPPSRENGIEHVYLNPQLLLLPPPAWIIDLVFEPETAIDPLQRFVPSNSNCTVTHNPARI